MSVTLERAEFIDQVLRFAIRADIDLYWNVDADGVVHPMTNCNDLFWWGCADAEVITEENFPLLVATFEEMKQLPEQVWRMSATNPDEPLYLAAEHWADVVWAARSRQMRPQGACYPKYATDVRRLLDEAGPPREIDLGNPQDADGNYRYAGQ